MLPARPAPRRGGREGMARAAEPWPAPAGALLAGGERSVWHVGSQGYRTAGVPLGVRQGRPQHRRALTSLAGGAQLQHVAVLPARLAFPPPTAGSLPSALGPRTGGLERVRGVDAVVAVAEVDVPLGPNACVASIHGLVDGPCMALVGLCIRDDGPRLRAVLLEGAQRSSQELAGESVRHVGMHSQAVVVHHTAEVLRAVDALPHSVVPEVVDGYPEQSSRFGEPAVAGNPRRCCA